VYTTNLRLIGLLKDTFHPLSPSFTCPVIFFGMASFIFPSSSNIPQNVDPQRVVTDTDIDPALLAWRPPQQMWPSPLPPPPPLPSAPRQANTSIDPTLLAWRPPQQTYTSQLPLLLPPPSPIQIQVPSLASHANHSTTISQSTSLQAPHTEDRQSSPASEPEPVPSIANTHSWAGSEPITACYLSLDRINQS